MNNLAWQNLRELAQEDCRNLKTMSDSTKSLTLKKTSLVVATLRRLIDKHHVVCQVDPAGAERQAASASKIDGKAALLNQILSSFLPSLRDRISALSLSLDASNLQEDPISQLELILKNLSSLDDTLEAIQSSIATISPQPYITSPATCGTDDYKSKELKGFRTTRMLWKLNELINDKLCELFLQTSIELIQRWEFVHCQPYCSKRLRSLANKRMELNRLRTSLWNFIDNLVQWSKRSDFDIMKEEWRKEAHVLDNALLIVLELSNHSGKGCDSTEVSDDQSDRDVPSEQVVRLANSALPIIKLTRLFMKTLCSPLANPLPFTLSPDMSSEQLELLFRTTATFPASVVNLGNCLRAADDADHRPEFISGFVHVVNYARRYLQSSLDMLDRHREPPSSLEIDHSLSANNFKLWSLTFHGLFLVATQNFVDIIDSFK